MAYAFAGYPSSGRCDGLAYMPQLRQLDIDFNYLSGKLFTCYLYNPSNGEKSKEFIMEKKEVQRVAPANGEDWVLVVQGE